MLKTDAERVYWKQISADYMSEERAKMRTIILSIITASRGRHKVSFIICCDLGNFYTVDCIKFSCVQIHYTEY